MPAIAYSRCLFPPILRLPYLSRPGPEGAFWTPLGQGMVGGRNAYSGKVSSCGEGAGRGEGMERYLYAV